MPFKKGEINNPKGRTKGAVGKKTAQWNEMGEYITNEGAKAYMRNLIELMNSEDVEIKLKAMDKYNNTLEYFKAKLSRMELVGDEKKPLSIEVTKTYDSKELRSPLHDYKIKDDSNKETNKGT